ncbi:glutamate--tRNA ligase [Bacteroidota bacterium]
MGYKVRVRFAPSPTGPLHIGGVRTALYNYLFAKQQDGNFILRIEDTDQARFVAGAEEYIHESLGWLGLAPDEGVKNGGDFGPYRQSERKDIYRTYAEQLIQNGHAYYAFDSPDELHFMRERLKSEKDPNPQYNALSRGSMKNSISLPKEDVDSLINEGVPYVIRLKVPKLEDIRFDDIIRGRVVVSSSTIDDKILLKSDGMPTYHLANVVDDHLMEITHVIRGEEWLPSAPLHVLLYKNLGWKDSMPEFAHLPLLLKPEGSGKLSKRDGDKHGFPVFPIDWKDGDSGEVSKGFKETGFFADTTINFLALLGWNSGTEQEIFNKDELISAFSLERVHKAGAKFDIDKAKWLNQQYLKEKPAEELGSYLLESCRKEDIECSIEKANRIAWEMRERVTFPTEFLEKGRYFFKRPVEYEEKVVNKKWTSEAVKVIKAYSISLQDYNGIIDAEKAKELLNKILEDLDVGMGRIMQALRVAITGLGGGIDLMVTIEILGKEEVAERISIAIDILSDNIIE